jgi:elongation factor Ts
VRFETESAVLFASVIRLQQVFNDTSGEQTTFGKEIVAMKITAQMVKELRERTGAPMMGCKQALEESGGDLDKAVEILRTKGLAAAKKKAGRITAEGAVGSYIHAGGKIGVLVEVNCETDFVARTDDFQALVKDIAMHIAAADPRFVRREEVTQEDLDRERDIYRRQALEEGKPEQVVDRIVEGKVGKFYGENVLLEQPFIKNPDVTVGELIAERVGKIGENIQIRRFARYQLGEGLEKRDDDFAAEVQAAAGT